MLNIDFKDIKITNALYIVSTPIGNMEDITLRALKILTNVKYIFCEDTRVTNKLLAHYNINKKSLFIYNDFSSNEDRKKIIDLIKKNNSVAIVSDAGTPLISDPGFKLVKNCIKENIKIIPICGASAILSALVSSGIPTNNFLFYGFLSEKENERTEELTNLKNKNNTIILYESPKRIIYTLKKILDIFGDIEICIAREITKIYEEIKTNKLTTLINYYNNEEKQKGEFVIVLNNNKIINENIDDKLKIIYDSLKQYMKLKDIVNFIVKINNNYKKNELYDLLLNYAK